MPKEFEAEFAEHLIAHADDEVMIADVPNNGFHLAVAAALEDLGYKVDCDPFRPRLTIHQKSTA